MWFQKSGARNVLVIKLEGVGEFVSAEPAMEAVRRHHGDDKVFLLTTDGLDRLAKAAPYFDVVWSDGAPSDPDARRLLMTRLRKHRFARVYDFDKSDRSNKYFQMLRPFPPKWSGSARGCAFYQPRRTQEKLTLRQQYADQVERAGVETDARAARLDWALDARKDAANMRPSWYGLNGPFVLMAPSANTERQWPQALWGRLAGQLLAEGVTPVLVGGRDKQPLGEEIAHRAPGAINLAGKTDYLQLAALAAASNGFVADDTGISFLLGASGSTGVMILGPRSEAHLAVPNEHGAVAMTGRDLSGISVEDVLQRMRNAGHISRQYAPRRAV